MFYGATAYYDAVTTYKFCRNHKRHHCIHNFIGNYGNKFRQNLLSGFDEKMETIMELNTHLDDLIC